ncbi:hypothetical protein KR76_00068 [Pimelobacter simplex]|uniref:Uncharacterized protein n=1 Tax=Nocardioides simplex TaxID=2045 RepID=A0A0C5WY63_NOCSI|nr:hypothetical protein KR76_00068 [Pimelobacter simplex]
MGGEPHRRPVRRRGGGRRWCRRTGPRRGEGGHDKDGSEQRQQSGGAHGGATRPARCVLRHIALRRRFANGGGARRARPGAGP